MSNNTVLNLGTGGDTIQTIDNTSFKTPVTALANSTGANIAVVDSSGRLNTVATDEVVSGNLTAASTSITTGTLNNKSTASIQITGTGIGTLQFQTSVDGTNFVTVPAISVSTFAQTTTSGLIFGSAGSANDIYQVDIAGIQIFNVICSAYTSGTFTITIRSSTAISSVSIDSPLPTGTNSIGRVSPKIDDIYTGSITASSSSTTGSAGQSTTAILTTNVLNAQGTTVVYLAGTFTATVQFEVSTDGTNFVSLNGMTPSGTVLSSTGSNNSTVIFATSGYQLFRIRCSTYTSGTITPVIRVCASGPTFIPTIYSMSDGGNGNGSVGVASAAMSVLYNGSTWDRNRGMGVSTTTGDTGAKTATGNGATITNVGNKGIQIVVNLGTVSGVTPTAVFKVQGSIDGGTNWYDIPGATTASLSATGIYGITIYPGISVTAGTTTSGTTAGASHTMTRTWRMVWTIGGTTPSFTITSITYMYIPN